MYLKSLKIKNFRKFGIGNNDIFFADSGSYIAEIKENESGGKYSCQKTTINTIAKLTNICYTKSTPK